MRRGRAGRAEGVELVVYMPFDLRKRMTAWADNAHSRNFVAESSLFEAEDGRYTVAHAVAVEAEGEFDWSTVAREVMGSNLRWVKDSWGGTGELLAGKRREHTAGRRRCIDCDRCRVSGGWMGLE